jgi:hypothetical protein
MAAGIAPHGARNENFHVSSLSACIRPRTE